MHEILNYEPSADQINDIEDYDYLPQSNSLALSLKNGKLFMRESDGREHLVNNTWPGEVPWNVNDDRHGGFYYADLNNNRIYDVAKQPGNRQIILDLNQQRQLVDSDHCDEMLRTFSVDIHGNICVNGRMNILVVTPQGQVTAYPGRATCSLGMRWYVFTVWLAAVLSVLILVFLAFKLLRYTMRHPTELAKIMFYLFLIAVAGIMAAGIARNSVLDDLERLLIRENQQIAVVAARHFDADAISAISGKADYDNSAFKRLESESDKLFRPAGSKNLSAARSFALYKLDNGSMRVLVVNSWRSLWQPLPNNAANNKIYTIAAKNTVESEIEHFGKKAYIQTYAPVTDRGGTVIALLRVSYDLTNVYNELRAKFWRDLIGIIFMLITFHLIIVELNKLFEGWKISATTGNVVTNGSLIIRQVSFLVQMTGSLALLYSTVRIAQLGQNWLALPGEIIMALPFVVEMITVVLLSMFITGRLEKWGWKPQMIGGVLITITGCLLTWLAQDVIVFLSGSMLCGAAAVMQSNAMKTFVVCESDVEQRKLVQVERSAGGNAGGLCGIIIGTMIATYGSLQTTFFAGALVAVVLLVVVCLFTTNRYIADSTALIKRANVPKAMVVMFSKPRMFLFMLMLFYPLYFLDSFFGYLVPLTVKNWKIGSEFIGYASFIGCILTAYFSKPICLALSRKISVYKCILCGFVMYLAATVLLQFIPTPTGIIISSVLFGIGACVNGSLATEMFMRAYNAKEVGVNNINNITAIVYTIRNGIGPVILGFCWQLAPGRGIIIYCGVAVLLAVIYLLIYRKDLAK